MRQMLSLAAATALFSAPAFADDDKPKRLSIDISAGVRPDMAQLGATITQDGTVDTADSTVANLLYSTDKAFMSDRNNMTIWDASQATDSTFKLMGAKPGVGGAMLGMELGARARYELDDVIDFPLYVQAGFHYTSKISGGEQSRTLGDVSQNNDTVSALFTLNGLDPADYDGGVMKNEYDASWVEIPFTLGVKAGFPKKPYTHAYGGLGLSYFSGGFSVAMDVDENYSRALATHVDTSTFSATDYSPGAVKDTIEFKTSGMGLNYGLGVQAGIKRGVAFFFEYNGSGTAETVYSSNMKAETRQLLTATSSETLATVEPEWFNRIAFPVVVTGASFRTGVRYYFF